MAGGNADYDTSFRQSLWISWGLFFDPGTQTGIAATDDWRVQFVAVILSICGFVFNLAVLGLVVDKIRSTLRKFHELRNRIVANGHALVLGWGDKTLFLLTELLAAEKVRRKAQERRRCGCCPCRPRARRVVILAQRPVLDMAQEVAMHLGSLGLDHTSIQYREGDPSERTELDKVSAPSADDILIMATERGDSDQYVVQTLLALNALPSFEGYAGDVLVEMRSIEGVNVAKDVLPMAVGIIARHAVNRILVLRALVPPVGFCYLDLVSFKESDPNQYVAQELHVCRVPQALVGLSFSEVCDLYTEAVVCGIKNSSSNDDSSMPGSLVPDRTRVLEERDRLVLLAASPEAVHSWARSASQPSSPQAPARCAPTPSSMLENVGELVADDGRLLLGPWIHAPRVVLLIGCPPDFPDILQIVDSYLASGSSVHVLSERPLAWRKQALYQHFGAAGRDGGDRVFKRITVTHHFSSTTCKWSLAELPLAKADCVMVLGDVQSDGESPSATDSRSLSSVISIRGLLQEMGRKKGGSKLKVVTELLDPKSQKVVEANDNVRRHGSFVYTSALETALFAMAAENKVVCNALMTLLTPSSGAGHIAALPLHDFVEPGETVSYFDLHTRIMDACGGILLGWKLKSARYPELNPRNKTQRRIERGHDSDVLLILRPQGKVLCQDPVAVIPPAEDDCLYSPPGSVVPEPERSMSP
eukprot:CAMPEP_0168406330 /NCGR_PEP_ID=MMETSP0228-20121227/25597_1 /TAXON_ID=133427 /ORGANISM="Protoceratium reticulatum, Strain CCCM 535 (=CCMP 1889)" /LENGTH=702 /DNA_ID=CAMNT_0008419977 /DNA_START=276 /DNA_END=2384 /DNA_ORIENTATION=+